MSWSYDNCDIFISVYNVCDFCFPGEELPKENVVEQIFSTMWKYVVCFT